MKIVVIGGTGLIGSKLVQKLRADGHDPLAASPDTGVDAITGQGLAEALAGAQVVVDVSNAPDWGDAEVMDFFRTSARNIASAETTAGIAHHVALSVVGTDRLQGSGYFRAKLAQEEAIKAARHPQHDPARDAVLRVHRSHRRFQHPRRDRSAAAPATSSPKRPMTLPRPWPISPRARRSTAPSSWPVPNGSGWTSSSGAS